MRTPVLWEQDGKGALFQQTRRIVLLRERLDAPMVRAVHIPRLWLVMLQCSNNGRQTCRMQHDGLSEWHNLTGLPVAA